MLGTCFYEHPYCTESNSLSCDKCTYYEALWIEASARCPKCNSKYNADAYADQSQRLRGGQRHGCVYRIKGIRYSHGFRGGNPTRGKLLFRNNRYCESIFYFWLMFVGVCCSTSGSRCWTVVRLSLGSPTLLLGTQSPCHVNHVNTNQLIYKGNRQASKQTNNYLLLFRQRELHHFVLLPSQGLLLILLILTVHCSTIIYYHISLSLNVSILTIVSVSLSLQSLCIVAFNCPLSLPVDANQRSTQ